MNIIEFDEVCKSCRGTGLYKGMGERDGFAVVCSTCDGTGCHHVKFEYESFQKRKESSDIKQVLETNPGICVGGVTEGKYSYSSFGGMSYADWAEGKAFESGMEMRGFTCPAWWYQCADYSKKPDWDKCPGFGTFSSCPHFGNKEECWKQWDKEQKKK